MSSLAIAVTLFGMAAPAETPAPAVAERPRVGLVLSGGGARGAAHAGVLAVLERKRVPVDYIVGTSMGALVGGFYASGMSPGEIIAWLEDFDYVHAAHDRPPRRALSFRRKQDDYSYALPLQLGFRDGALLLPRGLINAHELGFHLRAQTVHTARWDHFDEFPVPFRAVATDIEFGEAVVLERGPLADALLASMAVPGVVAPFELDGRLLVDGGLTDNLPVGVARSLGAEVVIAVDIATPLASREELDDVIGVSAQVINLVGLEAARAAVASLGDDDLLVEPDVSGISAADFDRIGEAIERGMALDAATLAALERYALPPDEWREWLRGQRSRGYRPPTIHFIEIDNRTTIDDRLVRARLSLRPGSRLSLPHLRRDIDALYSVGEFDRIAFQLVERDGRSGLRILLTPRELGPNYLRAGLHLRDDFEGASEYHVLLMHTRTRLNRLNGEWRSQFQVGETRRVASEWFQPLRWRGDWFLQPQVEFARTGFDLFDAAGTRVARYELQRDAAGLEFGWQWRNIGQVALSRFREDVDARPRIGDPALARFDRSVSGWDWRLTADQLDDWNFPADAWFVDLDGRHTPDFARARAYGLVAWTLGGRDRLLLSGQAGAATAGVLPLHESFGLGGFLSLSGLRQDELRGDYLFAARLLWYRRLLQLPTALGDGFYFGLSHERGNVWASRDQASLGDLRWGSAAFVGADLSFGALYLGAGRADNGDSAGYLFLQRSFR